MFWLGPLLMAVGLVLLFMMKVWPKVDGSPKSAAWMVGVGFGLCLADVLFLMLLVAAVGS